MYPDHYAVPKHLKISLLGTVRWKASDKGHHVLSLWRDPVGNVYYCCDVWTVYSLPFWDTTRLSDLVEVTPSEFAEITAKFCNTITDDQERTSLAYRFEELVYLWGYADGIDMGLLDRKAKGNA